MKPWVNVQAGNLQPVDVDGLKEYSGVILIAAWANDVTETLPLLDKAGVPIACWRFVGPNPMGWEGWPGAYIARQPLALFANEPDLEGWPNWYAAACDAWHQAGGKIARPPQHDESKWQPDTWDGDYDAYTWHCYAGDFTNRDAVRLFAARTQVITIFGSEYARQGEQSRCLTDLAAAGVTEPAALFIYPTWQGHEGQGFDLRGVTFDTPPPQKGPTMQGIDVSSEQPGTDWAKVAAAGVQFAAVKATEGTGYANPFFAADWAGLKGNGLVRIAYHYARPDLNNSPEEEANYFLSQVGQLETGDLLALDIEGGAGDLGAWAAAWCKAVDSALGNPALLYSYPNFLDQHGLTMAAVGRRPLWFAGGTDTPPAPPLDWPDVAIWQKVTTEPVAGVAGKVDIDETDLSADQLRVLGKPAPGAATGIEAEALAWFEQAGVKLDRSHAIWTAALYPMYQRWRELAAAGDPLADAYHLGPAVAPEYGTTFGGSRPAGAIKLQNAHLGAYLREDGRWQAYLLAI